MHTYKYIHNMCGAEQGYKHPERLDVYVYCVCGTYLRDTYTHMYTSSINTSYVCCGTGI